jgi:redox-sensing transcriptional repressor
MNRVPVNTVERLSQYRRLLQDRQADGTATIHSHDLAALACVSPSQVRRDLMSLGCGGNPRRGYLASELVASIGQLLDSGGRVQAAALVGVGNLGRAILTYFNGRLPNLTITAAFDSDPLKTGRVIGGCRCLGLNLLEETIAEKGITAAILAVPAAAAQESADRLVLAGIRGILNYAPVPLRLPPFVFIDNRDMTTALEKVAYFARNPL